MALSGDRESLLVLGLVTARAIKELGVAVLMRDSLGRVRLMPSETVQVLKKPKLEEDVLDSYTVDEAVQIMLAQENTEDEIIAYLSGREERDASTSVRQNTMRDDDGDAESSSTD